MPRTVVLTFDNLGEASVLQRGQWDGEPPLGQHPSVTVALPRLLEELDRLQLKATFFVEAINCELNPAAVRQIAAGGHELGIHGWRHEPWSSLDPARERELLERSVDAFDVLGIDAPGFRPPGGAVNPQTPGLLRELGLSWASPHGDGPSVDPDGFAWIPFDWELVDAYHLMEHFAPNRESRGDRHKPHDPDAAYQRISKRLDDGPEVQTIILHAFLMLDDAWWKRAKLILQQLADSEASVVPGGQFAARLREGQPT